MRYRSQVTPSYPMPRIRTPEICPLSSPLPPVPNTITHSPKYLSIRAAETTAVVEMDLTAEQLKAFDGSNEGKPIYLAVRGTVYDVSSGKSFYGPGGPYCMFSGREASRALAKMSKSEEDINDNLDGLSGKEIGVLEDWEKKFQAKYPVVGRLR